MTTYPLDANVLIALTVTDHEHHVRASGVARSAVCPVVERALVRFPVPMGEGVPVAQQVLHGVHATPGVDFWPDSLSYAASDLGGVRGHRQVTDAYLVSLAAEHSDSVLVTMDEGLARSKPDGTLLLPPLR